ncbi:carbohydrate porin [Microcoleus sp. AR_TQ3_B6]
MEANYYLQVTARITILPSLYVIGNLNNFSGNPTVFVGHLRTYFSF